MKWMVLTAILATPVQAQSCMPFEAMAAGLAQTWSEMPRIRALTSDGSVLVIFASGASGTWTAIIVTPEGTACQVAFGDAFEALEATAPGTDG